MKDENTTAPVTGGNELEIQFQSGGSEKVIIRQLAVKDFPSYVRVIDDEPRAAELLCGKSGPVTEVKDKVTGAVITPGKPGWGDLITFDSLSKIVEMGEELNADFFRWAQRRAKRAEKFMPGAVQKAVLSASS